MKIVSVVPNSAERDARVMKEALTLSSAGHDVHVVGIQEAKYPSYRTTHKDSVEVYRVPHSEIVLKYRKRIRFLSLASVFIVLTVIGYIGFSEILKGWLAHALHIYSSNLTGPLWMKTLVTFGFIAVIGIVIYGLTIIYKKNRRTLRRLLRRIIHPYNTIANIYSKRLAIKNMLYEKIIELEPDLIYCHEVTSLPACVKAKQKLGVPMIYDAHEFYDGLEGDNAKMISKLNEKIHSKYINDVDHIVTVSQTILDMYEEKYPSVIGKGSLLPNAVPVKDIPEYDGRLHETAKLPSKQKILLYQGGISRPRLVHEVMLAAELMPQDWSVVLMGPCRDQSEFEALEQEINRRCHFSLIEEKLTPQMRAELEEIWKGQYLKAYSAEIAKADEEEEDKDKHHTGFNVVNHAVRSYEPFLRDYTKVSSRRISKSKSEAIREKLDRARRTILTGVDTVLGMEVAIDEIAYNKAYEMALWRIYRKYKDELYIPPRCKIIPPAAHEELHLWTQGASAGIIPYPITSANHWGCAPNKLWEYPTAGVPIISTPSKEIRALLRQYEIGWTISADPKAEEIALLVSNLTDEELRKAKRNCQKFVRESNWNIYSKGWLEQVEKLCENLG